MCRLSVPPSIPTRPTMWRCWAMAWCSWCWTKRLVSLRDCVLPGRLCVYCGSRVGIMHRLVVCNLGRWSWGSCFENQSLVGGLRFLTALRLPELTFLPSWLTWLRLCNLSSWWVRIQDQVRVRDFQCEAQVVQQWLCGNCDHLLRKWYHSGWSLCFWGFVSGPCIGIFMFQECESGGWSCSSLSNRILHLSHADVFFGRHSRRVRLRVSRKLVRAALHSSHQLLLQWCWRSWDPVHSLVRPNCRFPYVHIPVEQGHRCVSN